MSNEQTPLPEEKTGSIPGRDEYGLTPRGRGCLQAFALLVIVVAVLLGLFYCGLLDWFL